MSPPLLAGTENLSFLRTSSRSELAPSGTSQAGSFVVAPDSFKGTHSSAAVARAMAAGVVAAGGEAIQLPLADGGEGTIDCLRRVLDGQMVAVEVQDPLGSSLLAEFLGTDDGVAVIETARASGLGLCPVTRSVSLRASTFGTGQLIAAAAARGYQLILVAVGGSATTDGGAGALKAIRTSGGLGSSKVRVLCDVTTPFEHAARTFAPQKGADADGVETLSRRLDQLALTFRKDPRGVSRTGCAGGLAGALWSECDAELVSGADYILDLLDFDSYLSGAIAVITGEGCLDGQTFHGKLVSRVIASAQMRSKPCHAIAGRLKLTAGELESAAIATASVASSLEEIEEAAALCTRKSLCPPRLPAAASD